MSTKSLSTEAKWAPSSTIPFDTRDVITKVVQNLPELYCEDPMDGEHYPWANNILDPLQDYAFTKGFAVVTLSGSEKKGRMRFVCMHHGKPQDT